MRLLVNATAYGDPPGGAGLRARHLYAALAELTGHELVFLLAEDTPASVVPPGAASRRLPVRAADRLARFLKLSPPTDGDVFLTDHYPALSALPTLITLHDDGGPFWRRALIRRHLRRAAGVVAVSGAVRDAWGVAAAVVPNGVALPAEDIAVPPSRAELLLVDPGPRHKGAALARRVAVRTGLPLREVGRGVRWLPQDELWREIASAAVVLCPAEREAFGLVALEAMALGRPVVVSDLPAFREILGAHAHYGADEAGLAAAVGAALAMSDERRLAAREHARAFTWGASARKLAEALPYPATKE